MQPQPPVIRSYKGPDRPATEAAYRADARQAATAGWHPVAHRWTSTPEGEELAVVFEMRAPKEPAQAAASKPAAASEPAAPGSPAPEAPRQGAGEPQSEASAPAGSPGPDAGALARDDVEADLDAGAGLDGEAEASPDVPIEPAIAAVRAVDTGEAGPRSGSEGRPAVPDASAARSHARATYGVIDLHCAGEPLRLIRSGYPQVPFAPIGERRRWVLEHADGARQALMLEPRGHRDMYGAVLLPPYRSDADIAVLFMHNEGYSTMCGHGVIAMTAALIEEGLYPATTPQTVIRWETPAGLVTATADVTLAKDGAEVERVRFVNVPAYLHAADLALRPDGVELHGAAGQAGSLRAQLAFGGAYYGIVDAADLGLRVVPAQIDALTRAGAAITESLRRDHQPSHPADPDLGFVYGTIIVDRDPASSPDGRATDATMRNVTVFADAEVDRSPCGSGTSALLAWLLVSGHIAIGQEVINAGITGEAFRARVEERTMFDVHDAAITSVEGTGFVTGYATFVVDDRDRLGEGFLLR